jgi:hypothetical protein
MKMPSIDERSVPSRLEVRLPTGGHVISVERLIGPGAPLNSDLDAVRVKDYVEHEFIVRGVAGRYRLPDPALQAESVDAGHPYTTRMLVRRPNDPASFNGTVVVEWLNVSTGQDVDFVYAATRELVLREGYAWVGVSAQRVGVEKLVAWNPLRYGPLSVAAPLDDPRDKTALDPANASIGAAGGDVLCWDIYSQLAQIIKSSPEFVLGASSIDRIIAAGESQSAFRLSRYFNCIQPIHRAYDGFLLYDRGGPHPLRDDVSAKVVSVGTDFLADYAGGSPKQDGDNQRWWELAGSSHVSLDEMTTYIDPQVRRDGVHQIAGCSASLTEVLLTGDGGAGRQLWSRVPNGDLLKAALSALTNWLAQGVEPPSAPRLVMGEDGKLALDDEGRTRGGIRYSAYDVPCSVNVGVTRDGVALAGYHLDFTPEEMTRRYGGQAAYVAQVAAMAEVNVAQGFLLAPEAERQVAEASQAIFDK